MPYFLGVISTVVLTFIIESYLNQPWSLSFILALVWGVSIGVGIFLHKRKDESKLAFTLTMVLIVLLPIFKNYLYFDILNYLDIKDKAIYKGFREMLDDYFTYLYLLLFGLTLFGYSIGKLEGNIPEFKLKAKHILIGFGIIIFILFLDNL